MHGHLFISIVEPGHRAIKFNAISGVGETIYREGYNFKIPAIERPIIYDVRTHPKTIKSATGSKGKSTNLDEVHLLMILTFLHRFANCQHQS